MRQDLLIGFFFSNKDVQAIALQQKAFLLRAWGITQSYSGKSPAEAHHDLPKILSGHFDRRLILLEETLKEFKINKENIKLWIEFESKFRKAVVRD
jgi:truncated hemoglobin YjbI